MNESFGPWTTGMQGRAALSLHWKKRLAMLAGLEKAAPPLSRRQLLGLGVVGAVAAAVPTFRAGAEARRLPILANANGWKLRATLQNHFDVNALSFSPDGRILAAGGDSDEIIVWNAVSLRELAKLDSGNQVYSLTFSPDGRILAAAGAKRSIDLWKIETAQKQLRLRGHSGNISSVAFSKDGGTLFSAGERSLDDGAASELRTWHVASGIEIVPVLKNKEHIRRIAVSPDGTALALGEEQSVGLCDVRTQRRLWTAKPRLSPHPSDDAQLDGSCSDVVFLADGKTLAVCSAGSIPLTQGQVTLLDATTGNTRSAIPGLISEGFHCMAVSPDGSVLAAGGMSTASMVLELTSKNLARSFKVGLIRLWNATTGKLLTPLNGHTQMVTALAFSPDGRTLASGSWDKTIKLWEPVME